MNRRNFLLSTTAAIVAPSVSSKYLQIWPPVNTSMSVLPNRGYIVPKYLADEIARSMSVPSKLLGKNR